MTSDRTSQPRTILILHSSDDLYGADRILLPVVQRLDRKRCYPIVVLPEDMKHVGLLSAELQLSGHRIHPSPYRRGATPVSQPIRDHSAAVDVDCGNTSMR